MRPNLAALLLVATSACAAPKYLARVNDVEISAADLKREFKKRHAGHQSFLADERSIRSFVERIVDLKLLAQEGYRLGIDDDPDLEKDVERFRTARMLDHMAKAELDEKSRASPAEVQEVYDTKMVEMLVVQQLVVPTRDEAEAIHAQVVAGADLETLVRERSTGPSRNRGGILEVGWGVMPPAWEATVFALSDGGLSPVMESKDGYEFVRLVSRTKITKKATYAEAAPRLKAILESRRREELKSKLASALWAKYQAKIEPFDDSVEALRTAKASKESSSQRAAIWTGGELLVREFADTLNLETVASLPPELARRRIREALENRIDPKLLALEAEARGYGAVPEIVQAVESYRDSLVVAGFEAEFLVKGTEVSDAEARQYYEEHQSELAAPEERRIAHVIVEKPETADEVVAKLAAGESFEDLVRTYSKDKESAKRGGALAWVERSQATGELAAVFDLQEGATSKPIKTSFGHHVFKVLEIKPSRPRPFEEVEAKIREKVATSKREAKRKDWVRRLRESSKIVVSTAAIRQFVKDNPLPENLTGKTPSHGIAGRGMGMSMPQMPPPPAAGADDAASAGAPSPAPSPAPTPSPAPAPSPAAAPAAGDVKEGAGAAAGR